MSMLLNMNIILFFMPSIIPPPGPIMFRLCCAPGSFFRFSMPRTFNALFPRNVSWTAAATHRHKGEGGQQLWSTPCRTPAGPHGAFDTHGTRPHTLRRSNAVLDTKRPF